MCAEQQQHASYKVAVVQISLGHVSGSVQQSNSLSCTHIFRKSHMIDLP